MLQKGVVAVHIDLKNVPIGAGEFWSTITCTFWTFLIDTHRKSLHSRASWISRYMLQEELNFHEPNPHSKNATNVGRLYHLWGANYDNHRRSVHVYSIFCALVLVANMYNKHADSLVQDCSNALELLHSCTNPPTRFIWVRPNIETVSVLLALLERNPSVTVANYRFDNDYTICIP